MAPSFVNKILSVCPPNSRFANGFLGQTNFLKSGKFDSDESSSGTNSSSSAGPVTSSSSHNAGGPDTSNAPSASSAQDISGGTLGGSTQTSSGQNAATSSTLARRGLETDSSIAEADEQFETVDYTNAPAVEHERVTRTNHEVVQPLVERERHQDHYKTIVQPIVDKQVLAEEHHQQTAAVQHRQFEHEDTAKTKARLAAEAQQFQNTRVEVDGDTTTSKAATQVAEHVHHHMHETVQPVIEREILQNTVTHTLVPVHETHHEAPHFHASTTKPVMSLADFNKQTGTAIDKTSSNEISATGTATSGGTTSGTTIASKITKET